ncbi:MAG: hypothetical protein IPL61_27050 [Myxococcales bacterium]|nr:hypothetical protein [Myxococcales bacterium]
MPAVTSRALPLVILVGLGGACAGTAAPDQATPAASGAAPTQATPAVSGAALKIRELYARQGDAIVEAPAEDQAVAQGYADAPHGPTVDGLTMTILTARTRYAVGEPVRVVHVVEVAAGHESFVMGPKPAYGEYVDGALRTTAPEVPDYPWVGVYDGAVLPGPDADVNFEVTSYTFATPGPHTVEWRIGAHRSNAIALEIVR